MKRPLRRAFSLLSTAIVVQSLPIRRKRGRIQVFVSIFYWRISEYE